MIAAIDDTHDPARHSFVPSARLHAAFPLQNLPLGVFTPPAGHPLGAGPRAGVAIGDEILDLTALAASSRLAPHHAAAIRQTPDCLAGLMAQGSESLTALRRRLFELLSQDSADQPALMAMLLPAAQCTMHLPARIGDYTDFYAGIHHAEAIGALFRPDAPLLPNYTHLPIAYHGRASSVVVSGHEVRRPCGQSLAAGAALPQFAPTARLDYELEMGIWIGTGTALGRRIPIDQAASHIAGFCLLNDWSARDVQSFEYQPLGPFLAKNFCTSISPWIITAAALAPFRIAHQPRRADDPPLLPYLHDPGDATHGGLDIVLEVTLSTEQMRARAMPAQLIARSNTRHLYWSVAQMLAHHSSNGCNLRAGDLLGTGTISGPGTDSRGSLLETTQAGRAPITLPCGGQRRFLEDGDEVVLRARAERAGFATIGFGECRGRVLPAA